MNLTPNVLMPAPGHSRHFDGAPTTSSLPRNGHPVVAILIESDGERIHSVFGVSNPDKLDAIAKARAQSLA